MRKTLFAAFAFMIGGFSIAVAELPMKWDFIYTDTVKQIGILTNGVWWTKTASATVNTNAKTVAVAGIFTGNKEVLLDLSLPVSVPGDTANYVITNFSGAGFSEVKEIKFGPDLCGVLGNGSCMFTGTNLRRIYGLGQTKVTEFAKNLFNRPSDLPLVKMEVYDPADFFPPTLKKLNQYSLSSTPVFKGTMVMPSFVTDAGNNGAYTESFGQAAKSGGITNLVLAAPDLRSVTTLFRYCTLKSLTFGSTNLVSVDNYAFEKSVPTLKEIVFLPTAAVPSRESTLETLLWPYAGNDTGSHQLTIKFSPLAPGSGWLDLVSPMNSAEAANTAGQPERCVGVFVSVTGKRKAWMAYSEAPTNTLLVGESASMERKYTATHSSLAVNDTVTIVAATPYAGGYAEYFNEASAQWVAYTNFTGSSFVHTHQGRLSRVIWTTASVGLAALNVSAVQYGKGVSFSFEGGTKTAEGLYHLGDEVTVTALGRAAYPHSRFVRWESGVAEEDATNATVTVTLAGDTELKAVFEPLEWLYDPTTKTISDGEWQSAAVTTNPANNTVSTTTITPLRDYSLWLDLSLPVRFADDPVKEYHIRSWTSDSLIIRFRLGEYFEVFNGTFGGCRALAEWEGMGKSKVKKFGWIFLYTYGPVLPIQSVTYVANDFVPETLEELGGYDMPNGPKLVGSLRVPNLRTTAGAGSVGSDVSGVTNLVVTSERLSTIVNDGVFKGMKLESLTLGSTNFLSIGPASFAGSANTLKEIVFLPRCAVPVKAGVMDNLLYYIAGNDKGIHQLTVKFSPLVPSDRWASIISPMNEAETLNTTNRPPRCVGVYETSAGVRKAWMAYSEAPTNTLVVGESGTIAQTYSETHTGLEIGDPVTVTGPSFYKGGYVQYFDNTNGNWVTYTNFTGKSFTYTHEGRFCRIVWDANASGFAYLHLTADAYGDKDSFEVSGGTEVAEGLYTIDDELSITAVGRTTYPRARFVRWTSGVEGDGATNATVQLTLTGDTELRAVFEPLEWLYNPATKTITDGEWTSTAVTTNPANRTVSATTIYANRDYSLWLDLSLPVRFAADPSLEFYIRSFTSTKMEQLLRLGEHFESFDGNLATTSVLSEIDGLGRTKVKKFGWIFLYNYGTWCPLQDKTYEARDFIPLTLEELGGLDMPNGPKLVGTMELPNLYKLAGSGSLGSSVAGVTNLLWSCEKTTSIPGTSIFSGMKLQSLTIGSTNLTSAVAGSFSESAGTLKEMIFLAHPPATTALDNILGSFTAKITSATTPLPIYCSRYIQEWRTIAKPMTTEERGSEYKPKGAWGVYETAAGKRFYLVHRPSEYDIIPGFMLILR